MVDVYFMHDDYFITKSIALLRGNVIYNKHFQPTEYFWSVRNIDFCAVNLSLFSRVYTSIINLLFASVLIPLK